MVWLALSAVTVARASFAVALRSELPLSNSTRIRLSLACTRFSLAPTSRTWRPARACSSTARACCPCSRQSTLETVAFAGLLSMNMCADQLV